MTHTRIVLTALSAFFLLASALDATTQPAAAAVTCHVTASTTGPISTLRQLADALQPGQTGCLKTSQTFDTAGGWGIISRSGTPGSPITIRSEPGGRARVQGPVRVDGSDVVLSDVDFLGTRGLGKTNHIHVIGDRVTITRNDITSPEGICLFAGVVNGYANPDPNAVRTDDLLVDDNRIHGCGTTATLTADDSGVHGVYLSYTLNARITNNYVYDNRVRGIQLWPAAEGTRIERNVLDGNSGNLNIGSEASFGYFSRGTVVRDNIITSSTFAFPKDSHQVYGYFPAGSPDYGNVVNGNCLFGTDASRNFGGYGYAQSGNAVADPQYVDRAAKDFRLKAGSPCLGKGPVSAQPPVQPPPPPVCGVTLSAGNDVYSVPALPAGCATFTVSALEGNDTVYAGSGAVVVDGGAGSDTVSYRSASQGVTVNLHNGEAFGPSITGAQRLVGVENVEGSALADTLVGDLAANRLDGLGGGDMLYGEASSVFTAGSADTLLGWDDNDLLHGYVGNDVLDGGLGADVLNGQGGTDTATYASRTVRLTIDLDGVADDGQAGEGDNVAVDVENVNGGLAADTIVGSSQVNYLNGNSGDDTINGADGNDTLEGADGNDKLNGNLGADTLYGHDGVDVLHGNEDGDALYGGAQNDQLYGDAGTDKLDGGDGSDYCSVGADSGTKTRCE